MACRDWMEFGTNAFADVDPEKTIAILPTAAVEQHGPHLPVGVDSYINAGLLAALRAECPGDLDVRVLPIQYVGKSNEHLHAPGTLTLPADLVIRAWTEIGLSVARAGVKKLLITNSHGGNLDIIGIVARELRVQADMLAVKTQWGAFGHPAGLYSENERQFGIHGGDVETSLMLHFQPELVDMSKAETFRSSAQNMDNFAHLRPTGPTSFGWIASDLHPSGTVGEADKATAEKGAATVTHQIKGVIRLLRDMEAFELARLGLGV
ncbi:MAG: creatininase family protein [Pseudomonadota bacterium]